MFDTFEKKIYRCWECQHEVDMSLRRDRLGLGDRARLWTCLPRSRRGPRCGTTTESEEEQQASHSPVVKRPPVVSKRCRPGTHRWGKPGVPRLIAPGEHVATFLARVEGARGFSWHES